MKKVVLYYIEDETFMKTNIDSWIRPLSKEYMIDYIHAQFNPFDLEHFNDLLNEAVEKADIIIVDFGGLGNYGLGNDFTLLYNAGRILLNKVRDYGNKFWFLVSNVSTYINEEELKEYIDTGMRLIDYYKIDPLKDAMRILTAKKEQLNASQ